jgi:hypothetical protein
LKIIQSYWSKPSQGQNEGHIENRHTGGWLTAQYHFMSWALSCLSFRQIYDEVELYTDAEGKALLIDTLQLPYTKVHVVMDRLNHLPPLLWTAPKIYTYSLQTEPFIHADGDVYIWKRFDAAVEQAPLLAQSLEDNFAYYNDMLNILEQQGFWIPPVIASIDRATNTLQTVNAGVFGGNDLNFIHAYCKDLLRFYINNKEPLKGTGVGKLNPLDQFYFYHLTLAQKRPIGLLFPGEKHDFSELMLFNLVPQYQSYIHLLGATKKNPLYCQMVALHLRHQFPEYYNKLAHILTPTTPVATMPALPGFDQFFPSSLAALHHFAAPQAVNSSHALSDALNNCATLAQVPQLQTLVQQVFMAEDARYQLYHHSTALPDEEGRLPAFIRAKALLAATTATDKSTLLQQPLALSKAVSILALEYDVPAITARPNWVAHAEAQVQAMEPGQHIYLYVKHDATTVLIYPMGDSNQLLYYFSQGPFTGQALLDLLMEDEADKTDAVTLAHYTDMVFYCITNNVIFTGYLAFAD